MLHKVKIPWKKLEAFVILYRNTVERLINYEEEGTLNKGEIEALLPDNFKNLHANLTTILKEHASVDEKREEEEIEKSKISMIISVLQTIQSTFET